MVVGESYIGRKASTLQISGREKKKSRCECHERGRHDERVEMKGYEACRDGVGVGIKGSVNLHTHMKGIGACSFVATAKCYTGCRMSNQPMALMG